MCTTQVGTDLTDSWKDFNRYHKDGGHYPSAIAFSGITEYDIIQEADKWNQIEVNLPSEAVASNKESTTSSVSCVPCRKHAIVTLDRKRQVRCVWCSRVNFIELKVTMIFKNMTKDFAGLQVGENVGRITLQ